MVEPSKPAEAIREVLLEYLKYGAQARISHREIKVGGTTVINTLVDNVTQDLIVRLTKYIASQQLYVTAMKSPATWWDAYKDRWFPKWAKKLLPVKWRLEIIDVKALYPNLVLPEEQAIVVHERRLKSQWSPHHEPPMEGFADDVE